MKYALALAVLLLALPGATQPKAGVDVTMPLVEQTLRFIKSTALAPPPESTLLRAGVIRVCGEDFSRPGCRRPGVPTPRADLTGPTASRAWRELLESALAAESLAQGDRFDKTAFQRFVMDGMVDALGDPCSFYVAPKIYRKIASIPGAFVGFGLRVAPTSDSLRVVAVHEGSPAKAAGVLQGDEIVAVNGAPVNGFRCPIALAAIWGADGEKLTVGVRRAGGQEREIKINYQPWSFDAFTLERHGDIVVAHVRYFDAGLTAAVRTELLGACAGLVLDLRNAAGGDAVEMVALADLLLGDGSIGHKEMRGDLGSREWKTSAGTAGERLDIPVAVVTGGGTSGLAEVLVAALRQAGRALVVGRVTAGIDTLETIRPFKDGSAIQVTSTRLLGPGRTDLGRGLEPHLKTERIGVVELAVSIVKRAPSPKLDDLIEAARQAVTAR